MRRSFRSLLLAIGLSTALGGTGCAAPTLPLPPPSALLAAPDQDGIVVVTGESLPDAYVFALNEERDDGVIGRADAEGLYELRLRGQTGDTITVWQMAGSERGNPVQRTVPGR